MSVVISSVVVICDGCGAESFEVKPKGTVPALENFDNVALPENWVRLYRDEYTWSRVYCYLCADLKIKDNRLGEGQ